MPHALYRLEALGNLGRIGADDRSIGAARFANHRRCFDIEQLRVLLELHFVAAAHFDFSEHAEAREQIDALVGNEARHRIGRGLVVAQPTLLGFNMPFVGVTIAREQNALVLVEHLLAVCKGRLAELFSRNAFEGIGEFLERFRHGAIKHHVAIGRIGLRAERTEFELVAREGKGARAVAVGVVLLNLRKHIGAQVKHAVLRVHGSFAVGRFSRPLR